MKSVMNSKRSPFQVKRYGHDDGLRSSSVSASVACGTTPAAGAPAGRRQLGLHDAGRPQHAHDVGRRRVAEAEHDVARRRRPARRSTVSSFCRRLPARSSIFEPTALRLLTLPASRTRSDACRLPPSFFSTTSRPRSGPAVRAQHQVGVAVAVDVAGREPRRARRPAATRQHRPHRDARRPAVRCCRRCAPARARRPCAATMSSGRRCRDRRTAPRVTPSRPSIGAAVKRAAAVAGGEDARGPGRGRRRSR